MSEVERVSTGRSAKSIASWVILCVSVLFVVGSWLVVLLPQLTLWAWIWSVLATLASFYFVPLGIVILFWATSQWRRSRRRRAIGTACVGAAALAFGLAPLPATFRTAQDNGVELSFWEYFNFGPRSEGPASTLVYATVGNQKLLVDVWMPPSSSKPGPAVIYVHGGGFTMGSRGQRKPLMQWLTNHGYTVFDIDYRLQPQPLWREEARDVKCAAGWLAANARHFSIDPDRIVIAGDSAGGNLALLAAYTVGTGFFSPSCDVREHRPRAVIAAYAPTDTSYMGSGVPSIVGGTNNTYFGGSPEQVPEAYRLTSPLTFVRPGLPPTLLLQGLADHLNPYEEAEWLGAALAKSRVPHRTVLVPWAEHVFDLYYGSWGAQIQRGVLAQFLERHAS